MNAEFQGKSKLDDFLAYPVSPQTFGPMCHEHSDECFLPSLIYFFTAKVQPSNTLLSIISLDSLLPRLLIYSSQAMSCQGVSSWQGVTFLPSLAPQESAAAGCIQMTAPMECHRPPPWQQTLPTPSTSKYPDLLACLPETTLDTAPSFHSRPGMGW